MLNVMPETITALLSGDIVTGCRGRNTYSLRSIMQFIAPSQWKLKNDIQYCNITLDKTEIIQFERELTARDKYAVIVPIDGVFSVLTNRNGYKFIQSYKDARR